VGRGGGLQLAAAQLHELARVSDGVHGSLLGDDGLWQVLGEEEPHGA
jgi:hypothetical protein